MNARLAAIIAALSGAVGVTLGAFGAHALRSRLDARDLEIYETAVRYQMYHAFALAFAAWLLSRNAPYAPAAAWSILGGMIVFSGSLYLLVMTGQRWLGAVTPIGGVALIAGWLLMALAVTRLER